MYMAISLDGGATWYLHDTLAQVTGTVALSDQFSAVRIARLMGEVSAETAAKYREQFGLA